MRIMATKIEKTRLKNLFFVMKHLETLEMDIPMATIERNEIDLVTNLGDGCEIITTNKDEISLSNFTKNDLEKLIGDEL